MTENTRMTEENRNFERKLYFQASIRSYMNITQFYMTVLGDRWGVGNSLIVGSSEWSGIRTLGPEVSALSYIKFSYSSVQVRLQVFYKGANYKKQFIVISLFC